MYGHRKHVLYRMLHFLILGSAWQSPYRDLWSETFQQYIEHFKYPAKVIEQSQEQDGNNNKITGKFFCIFIVNNNVNMIKVGCLIGFGAGLRTLVLHNMSKLPD